MLVTPGYGSESSKEHGPHNRFSKSESPWVELQLSATNASVEQPSLTKQSCATAGDRVKE